ncbi:MAG: methyltransferase [Erythrobacter sp.]
MTDTPVPQIFSRERRAARAQRAMFRGQKTDSADWLNTEMESDCVERTEFMRLSPATAAIVGATSDELRNALLQKKAKVTLGATHDEEHPSGWTDQDLIISLNRLDTVNDLPGALLHYRHALRDGGVFIAQFLGAGSASTLRQILLEADGERPAARLHPQIDSRAATSLLDRAGFKRQVVDSRTLPVSYRSFDQMIADLRDQALTNVLSDQPPPFTKQMRARALGAFEALRDAEGRVHERFEILTLTCWR